MYMMKESDGTELWMEEHLNISVLSASTGLYSDLYSLLRKGRTEGNLTFNHTDTVHSAMLTLIICLEIKQLNHDQL